MQSLEIGNTMLEVVSIPPGEFLMGSTNEVFAEVPAHWVRFRTGFGLGKYPVTQAQWLAVMGDNPSTFVTSLDHPVEGVRWDQAVEFCARLSIKAGLHIRLPSEAEWEYACRAGTVGEFFFSEDGPFLDDSEIPQNVRLALDEFAWFDLNSVETTHPIGLKLPNPWGLHDMLGNVWEWCADVWHDEYLNAPNDGSAWIEGNERQPRRCLRGGAWDMNAFRCRSSYRSYDHREMATHRIGFRVAVDEI